MLSLILVCMALLLVAGVITVIVKACARVDNGNDDEDQVI